MYLWYIRNARTVDPRLHAVRIHIDFYQRCYHSPLNRSVGWDPVRKINRILLRLYPSIHTLLGAETVTSGKTVSRQTKSQKSQFAFTETKLVSSVTAPDPILPFSLPSSPPPTPHLPQHSIVSTMQNAPTQRSPSWWCSWTWELGIDEITSY